MFLAAIGFIVDPQDRRFGYVHAAILALAHVFRLAVLDALGLRFAAKQPLQQQQQYLVEDCKGAPGEKASTFYLIYNSIADAARRRQRDEMGETLERLVLGLQTGRDVLPLTQLRVLKLQAFDLALKIP